MKKSVLVIMLSFVTILLSGCCLSHDWKAANCENPKTCIKCEKTEGEALGHTWVDATCEEPKTCEECGITKGEALGHEVPEWAYDEGNMSGSCAHCGGTITEAPDWELLGKRYLPGQWIVSSAQAYDGTDVDLSGGNLTFHKDGTVGGTLLDGTWSYKEFWDAEIGDGYIVFSLETSKYGEFIVNLAVEDTIDFLAIDVGDGYIFMKKIGEIR